MSSDRVIVVMAIAPFLLVTLVLKMLLGDWVWTVAPALFVIGVLGLRYWQLYRDQVESDDPLEVPGHGNFAGEEKLRLARRSLVFMFAMSVLLVLGFVLLPRLSG